MSNIVPTISMIPMDHANESNHQIYMSKRLLSALKIKTTQDIQIFLGKKLKTVNIQTIDSSKDEILVSKNMLNDFSLPMKTYPFQGRFDEDSQTLFLGPIVALLTDIQSTEKEETSFGPIQLFCEELHQILAKSGGFFYVFTYHDFSLDDTRGYYFENGEWKQSQLPLPDVIYNRIHSRKMERGQKFKDFRTKTEQLNIPFFNDSFLSKWEVYQHLIGERDILSFLPDTKILSEESLEDFINQYSTIFIKPIHGSQGRNIIKLAIEEKYVSFQTSVKSFSEQITKKYPINTIPQQLNRLLHNRIYIIQQGIPLMEYESKTMDFRVLVHKNQKSLWKVTSIVARISAEQEFVSNLARGGVIMKPYLALSSCFSEKMAIELTNKMKELSLKAAAIVDSHSDGIIGELGIDIGIDPEGKLWIIEINSKPSKSFENHPAKIRPSAKAIVQFCTMLAFHSAIKEGGPLN